ncbi:nuclear transport factor 2 family protein [Dyella sp. C9]|uniref:nuclear transport factor 2 family protein n=1 Tax=Dyella sp. C9 TaxID=2202154 RepID=UPI001E4DC739|nr:nuclear transport factor 2 family protein [Dyella sp. C9]
MQNSPATDPARLVQRQLEAYSRKDIDAWLATYARDAEQYALHGERLAKGHEELRRRMLARFAEPDLHAQLLSRVVRGAFVTDLERVTRTFPEGRGVMDMLCIYEVTQGHIVRASFAFGESRLAR